VFTDVLPQDLFYREISMLAAAYPFDFVEEAVALGTIKGDQDGTFNPYGRITQVQVALMLVRAGGAAPDTPPAGYRLPFHDVPDYAADAIAVAYYKQLVSGATPTCSGAPGAKPAPPPHWRSCRRWDWTRRARCHPA
jgi:hypothetical protein